jgi:hypothetical protein
MTELLSISLSRILRALLIWIPILVGSVVLLGVAIFALSHHRFRRLASAHRRPAPRSRVWTARILLTATQGIVLPLLALATAIPFSLQQGAADAIESASPRILDWGVRTGAAALKERLAIADDAAIVDLGKLAPVLHHVAPTATRARGLLRSLSVVPQFTNNAYFRAASSAVDEAASADLRVTWDDLFRSAHRHFSDVWAGQARIVASFLRASSLHFLQFLAGATAIVDLLCVLVILLLTRSGPAMESKTRRVRETAPVRQAGDDSAPDPR